MKSMRLAQLQGINHPLSPTRLARSLFSSVLFLLYNPRWKTLEHDIFSDTTGKPLIDQGWIWIGMLVHERLDTLSTMGTIEELIPLYISSISRNQRDEYLYS